jgi:phasin protein
VTTMPSALFPFGEAHTNAMLNLQKDLIELYEQASRSWLNRVKSEMELWSGLASKLTRTHSVPEAMEAYQKCVREQMQMAADDGRRLFDDCQMITQKIASAFNGRSNGNTAAGGAD